MKRKLIQFPLSLTLGLSPLFAMGAELNPNVMTKHYLQDAIQVKMTPRGLDLFKNHMSMVARNLGISYNDFYIPEINWDSNVSYKVEDLNLSPENKKLVVSTQQLLSDWFAGLRVNELQPSIKINNLEIKLDYNNFSISTNEALLKSLNKKTGVVLTVEADVKNVDITAEAVRALNLKTPKLGKIGIDDAEVRIAHGNNSLKVRINFYVHINEAQVPEFQVVELEQNFNAVDVTESHSRLITPSIQLVINGTPYQLNTLQIEKQYQSSMPTIIEQLKKALHTLAQDQLPAYLNQMAKDYIVNSFEEAEPLPAPNSPNGDKNPLQWGLHLTDISQNQGININVASFIEDPLNPRSAPQPSLVQKTSPQFNNINPTEYDVAVSVDQNLIDRALQLSFERHLFEKVGGDSNTSVNPKCQAKQGNPSTVSSYIHMTAPPRITSPNWSKMPAPLRGETFAKIKLKFQVSKGTVTGVSTLAINDGFEMGIDIITKIQKSKDSHRINVHLWDIDDESLTINDHDITTAGSFLFQKNIRQTILSTLHNSVQEWRCNETTLAENIATPSIAGVPTQVEHLTMEPTGHFIMFLKYDLQNRGQK